MGEARGTYGEKTNTYRILSVKPEGKELFGRYRHQGKAMNVMLGWGGVDWIDLYQDRDKCQALVNTVTKHRVT
jgi:hypothetical protein